MPPLRVAGWRLTQSAGGPEVGTERGTDREQARIARKDDRQDSPSLLQLRLGQLLYPGREVPEPDRRTGRGRESCRTGRAGRTGAVLLADAEDGISAGSCGQAPGRVLYNS